jgi:hypothetical protein
MELFDHSPALMQKEFLQWSISDPSVGVVTAANAIAFKGVQFLFASVAGKIPLLCYDLGLTESQRNWCSKHGLMIKSLNCPAIIKTIDHWPFYVKPWAIENSPYPYTVWIDADCIVTGDLSKADLINSKETFFVKYFLNKHTQRKNKEYVYVRYPIKSDHAEWDYINTGVFGINKSDVSVVRAWEDMIHACTQDRRLLECFSNQDEGILNWVLQSSNLIDLCTDDLRYNFHAAHNTRDFPPDKVNHTHKIPCCYISPTSMPHVFCRNLQQHQDKFVLHFATGVGKEKKYYHMWD